MAKKNFILDTNVVLHDYRAIYNFQENDIYLPMIVLEELDKFKKGDEQKNFNARQFARQMDELVADKSFFTKGASLGEGKGRLFVITENVWCDEVANAFMEKIPDHYILAAAISVAKKHPKMQTVLVTKDVNLRMKARALGCPAEDYYNDKVEDVDVFERDFETFDGIPTELVDELYAQKHGGIALSKLPCADKVTANQCFMLRSTKASVMVRHYAEDDTVRRVDKHRAFGIEPRNAEQSFAMDLLMDPSLKLVALTGKAGTGKTLIALAAALAQHNDFEQVMLARPIVAMSNHDLGALPGDAKEKVSPYMQPLFDNLNVIRHNLNYTGRECAEIDQMQKDNTLIIEALAFIRGRSLSNTYFIIDEAQNLTPHEIKTIITRAGEGTKIVFTGDIHQIDSPYLDMQSNGLVYMIDKMKGQPLFGHVNLIKGERSELSELASHLL
ncbi:MAG: PhoH family protein [bacterium]|nr:PhoH family protein [Candidatus Colousia faecequi]